MPLIFARLRPVRIGVNPEVQKSGRSPMVAYLAVRHDIGMNTATLNQMWDTRPPRIPSNQGGNAMIAGVCEGIGVRYQIDPVLVRVAFVVTALVLGGGIALYALAWMCMPLYGKATAPVQDLFGKADGPKSASRLAVGLIILFAAPAGFGPLFGEKQTLSTVVIFILAAVAWYGLHQRQPIPPAGLLAAPVPDAAPGPDMSAFTPGEGYPFPPGRPPPPGPPRAESTQPLQADRTVGAEAGTEAGDLAAVRIGRTEDVLGQFSAVRGTEYLRADRVGPDDPRAIGRP